MNGSNIQTELGQWLEKRKHPRMPCSAAIEYAMQDQTYRNLSRDISTSGIFIETWEPFSIGDELTLTIPISNAQESIKVEGKVVRTEKRGMGVEFV